MGKGLPPQPSGFEHQFHQFFPPLWSYWWCKTAPTKLWCLTLESILHRGPISTLVRVVEKALSGEDGPSTLSRRAVTFWTIGSSISKINLERRKGTLSLVLSIIHTGVGPLYFFCFPLQFCGTNKIIKAWELAFASVLSNIRQSLTF